MGHRILIKTEKISMQAELNDSAISKMLFAKLPVRAQVNTWGDEIYFPVPVKATNENGVSAVQLGDIAYWPPSSCFCIFFGKTPVSTKDEIRPASEVTILGKLAGNPLEWRTVKDGEEISLENV